MSKIKILSDIELLKKAREHCAAGLRSSENKEVLNVGCNNAQFVGPIVVEVAGWLRDEPGRLEARKRHQTLADFTAAAVHNITVTGFSFQAAMRVIENAAEVHLSKMIIDQHAEATDNLATEKFGYAPSLEATNVKRSVVLLAKAVLWLEAYSFLTELGYQFESW